MFREKFVNSIIIITSYLYYEPERCDSVYLMTYCIFDSLRTAYRVFVPRTERTANLVTMIHTF